METNSTNPKEDLQAIREIMERSSRFLSLSGLSGIFSGVCALIGAAVAWFFILDSGDVNINDLLGNVPGFSASATRNFLALDALLVLGFALLGAFYFSQRKARKTGQQFWNLSSRRLLLHLMIPLVTGGIFTLVLVMRNNLELVPAALLIFYGLALVNAGKFTLGEIHYLGLTQIVLGILAAIFIQQGLLIWTIGFGLVHIVYGAVMYYRHERS